MEIAGVSSMATRYVLAELASTYAARTGIRVALESAGGVVAARRIEAGEPLDFVVLPGPALEALAAMGRVDPDTRVDIARARVAAAVRAGAPHPDLGSEQAVRDAVAAARRIGYSTGPSGRHMLALFRRWDATSRLVEAPPGVAVGTLVARGDADLGFQQLSELLHVEGIEVAGLLPPEIQEVTVFAGAVCAAAQHSAAARAFLASCAAPDAAAVKQRHGMEA